MGKKSKPARGPWRIGRPSVANGVQIFRDVDYPMGSHVICTMPEKGKGRTANARLIAAAPDLFEACEMIVENLNLIWTECRIHSPFIEVGQKAIDKAKGGG